MTGFLTRTLLDERLVMFDNQLKQVDDSPLTTHSLSQYRFSRMKVDLHVYFFSLPLNSIHRVRTFIPRKTALVPILL